ncbi:MAG: hypothetical protein WA445_06105, partial [Pseudolabrys sp.]
TQDYAPPIEQKPPEPRAPAFSAEEPSRRRSTIREPAPFASDNPPVPPPSAPPSPVVSSTGAEEPVAPKRGWWGKRLLGDKG